MTVRPGRADVRPTAQKPKTQQAYSWPSPTLGWVANANIAMSQPMAAYFMENWLPTATGIIMRRGCETFKTIGSQPVRAMFSYVAGNLRKLFAADDTGIFDITSVVSEAHPCTNGDWKTAQYQSSDGVIYIRGVNGIDTPFLFNGSSFSDTPALTFPSGSTAEPEDMASTWVYKNRFWFIQKETMDAWYLPVGQIGGELKKFSLGGQFKFGGALLMGATWSRDTGSGMNAMCAFFTTEGEVAIYQGDDPAEIATWSLVGVYRIGKPLGPKTMVDAGGDLITATDVGFIPLSTALQTDFSILGNAALSDSIVDAWKTEVQVRNFAPWNVAFWTKQQLVIVALPTIEGEDATWWVVNARTKAWAPLRNWDATCIQIFEDRCFYGTKDGEIVEANVGGTDKGQTYTSTCIPMFDQMGAAGRKEVSMLRAVLRGPYAVNDKLSVQSDYSIRIPAPPSAAAVQGQGLWGGADWGTDNWAQAGTDREVYQRWRSAFGSGEVHAPCLQITSGAIAPLDAELIRLDATFTLGEIVT